MHGRLHPAAALICVRPSLWDPTGCRRTRCSPHNSRCHVSSRFPSFSRWFAPKLCLFQELCILPSPSGRTLCGLYEQVMMSEVIKDPYLLINPTEGSLFSILWSYLLLIVCLPPFPKEKWYYPLAGTAILFYMQIHCKVNKVLRRPVKVKKKQPRKWERARLHGPSGYRLCLLINRCRSTNVQAVLQK